MESTTVNQSNWPYCLPRRLQPWILSCRRCHAQIRIWESRRAKAVRLKIESILERRGAISVQEIQKEWAKVDPKRIRRGMIERYTHPDHLCSECLGQGQNNVGNGFENTPEFESEKISEKVE
jgi:hypothetical protein